ncbi:hypothetical protein [Herminiimonas contaminans]|uniref:Uncharacterized protein n=1 Tax=Herminiimonas contaminans TaxID=1111140 RepID=A0ABS0ESC4_9BURK|nr:hypothetical protein [Herminiimonas contaminans]MBF8176954.1 hypothetical protein [Herminiimonas contaminans]
MNDNYVAPNGAAYALKIATPSPEVLQRRLKSGIYNYDIDQLQKRCSKCRDHWPADSEFFFAEKCSADGLSEWYKACYKDWRYPKGRKAAVDASAPLPSAPAVAHDSATQ